MNDIETLMDGGRMIFRFSYIYTPPNVFCGLSKEKGEICGVRFCEFEWVLEFRWLI